MSASRSSYSRQDRLFQFSMEFPVPSYLVALVAGDLQHVDVGPRSVLSRTPSRYTHTPQDGALTSWCRI